MRAARGVDVRTGGHASNVSMADLVDRIHAHGGPITAATEAGGRLQYGAEAVYHGLVEEEPVWSGGRVLGYVEHPPLDVGGALEVTAEELAFRGVGVDGTRWPLADVTALQVSTRSIQVGIRYVGTVQLTFPEASTYRWEALLHHLIREVWRRNGRGEITEFQPRITGR